MIFGAILLLTEVGLPLFFTFQAKCIKRQLGGAQLRVKRGSWGIGGKASQQARSVDDNRGTACENEKTLL